MHTYRDLIVWQKAVTLSVKIYTLTENFPKEERYALTSQIRRAATSIPANIAEGKLRASQKELRQFLYIAFASGGELETHIEIAKQIPITSQLNYAEVESLLNEVMRMLNVMISKVSAKA